MLYQIPRPAGPLAPIVFDDARFKVVVSGRRLGKTGQALRWLVMRAITCPRKSWENWYIAPTYKDAREIAWTRLLELIPAGLIKATNSTRLEIIFINGNSIMLKGADRPDSLVGRALWSAVFDEYGKMKPDTWDYTRPAFSDTNGSGVFIGTPRGANHFKDLYFDALTENLKQFKAYPIYKTIDSPWVPDDEVEMARSQMDARMFRQEYEGTFETWEGIVYEEFNEDNISTAAEYDPNRLTFFGMDFGWTDPTVILVMQLERSTGIWYITDEFKRPKVKPALVADVLRGAEFQHTRETRKLPCTYKDVDSIIAGSEINSSRQEGDGYSMKRRLVAAGIPEHKFRVVNPGVFKSIMSVRSKILGADGIRRLIIHPRCTETIKDKQKWHYREKQGLIYGENPDETPENHRWSHTMDAERYVIHTITPPTGDQAWQIQ